jgi:hypothetical protein
MIPIILVSSSSDLSLQHYFHQKDFAPTIDHLVYSTQTSIGINEVKRALIELQSKPIKAPLKYLIFPQAQLITPVAQQTLLKSLEDSPNFIQFILVTPSLDSLLPTIISRCNVEYHHHRPQNIVPEHIHQLAADLQSNSLSQKLNLAAKYAPNKHEAQTTIAYLILLYRKTLHTNPSPQAVKILDNLLECHQALTANTNPILSLEHLFLTTNFNTESPE